MFSKTQFGIGVYPQQIRHCSLTNINNDVDLGVDQLVAVVSKPLPSRGRYGTDLRTVLAEMRLRQKVTQHKYDVLSLLIVIIPMHFVCYARS